METHHIHPDICEQARLTRDKRFDGLFFTGVLTTGIFCRPICPAPAPKPGNVRYFRTAAAAFQAGLRPCLRCRPEAAPGSLAWNSIEPLLQTAVNMIDAGYLQQQPVAALADRLGISSRHLRRLFQQHLGTTPLAYARMQQTLFAKQLLTESDLSITDIAMAAAFGSIRRFNDHFKSVYGRSPRALRKNLSQKEPADVGCQLYLAYRKPYNFNGLLEFYSRRAVPGVECVSATSYARTFQHGQTMGWFEVADEPARQALKIKLICNRYDQLQPVVQRIRQMLDIDTDPQAINQQLRGDESLKPLVDQDPGLRIPGCWSIEEACIRAILGQRVTLGASIAMLTRVVSEYGCELPQALAGSHSKLKLIFPDWKQLRSLDAATVRIGGLQAATLRRLADVEIQPYSTATDLYRQITGVKGIGDWTAQYVLLRGLCFPDAWLEGDVVIRTMLRNWRKGDRQQREQRWRPWRGYVLLYLWQTAAEVKINHARQQ